MPIQRSENFSINIPNQSLYNEKIETKILLPKEYQGSITLKATWIAPDKTKWFSTATFKADNAAVIDEKFKEIALTHQAPEEGTYEGVKEMGIFTHMRPETDEPNLCHMNFHAQEIQLELYAEKEKVSETTIQRKSHFDEKIERTEIRKKITINGKERNLVGTLFSPKDGEKHTAALVIPGAQGGIPENYAALLASQGFVTFAAAFHGPEFADDGLPAFPEKVDLEYFQEALSHLKDQPNVNAEKIAFIGDSKGAEGATVYASYFPGSVKQVIGYVTPDVLLQMGLNPCWYLNGEPVKAHFPISFMPSEKFPHENTSKDPYDSAEILTADKEKNPTEYENAAIPIENSEGTSFLFFAGDKDKTIPSANMANGLLNRAKKIGPKVKDIAIKVYENAGHIFCFPILPYLPAMDVSFNLFGTWWGSGGTTDGNAKAAEDSFQRVVDTLKSL